MKDIFNFKLIQPKYFWIAIVLIGTIGIWLPFLLGDEVRLKDIPILFTTYYISLYFSGCLDSVINRIKSFNSKDEKKDLTNHFLNSISLIVLAIFLVVATILLNKNEYFVIALILSLIGTLISLRLWWKNNWDGQTYDQIVREEAKENHGNNW